MYMKKLSRFRSKNKPSKRNKVKKINIVKEVAIKEDFIL